MRFIVGNFVSKLWEKDVLGKLLQLLQQPAACSMRKSEMQDGTDAGSREMYKMWQTPQMVNRIAAIH